MAPADAGQPAHAERPPLPLAGEGWGEGLSCEWAQRCRSTSGSSNFGSVSANPALQKRLQRCP
ncbi:hypothetical protein FCN13_23935 [Pseudomonas sp. UMC631]|nr:hypothetical protein [Pseudomonas sp. UMA643]NTY21411.1 hypothetical protein [Pseudomonas sp. UMC3103]NTY27502.1 hypothetical protein [Pseudomonas sp. UMA603]NTY34101.1 hypothetical protein [Pseudomonas sp. UMC3129]NTY56622.1 hypothetical protein [Pseudomonas sp. UMC631]NTY68853.1 hypothetical protein [Pseudomonas sp. UMC3106]NUA37244.1 hypothetical protein [Pseudomonas sp. UMA601]